MVVATVPAGTANGALTVSDDRPSSLWLPTDRLTVVDPHVGISGSQKTFGKSVAMDAETTIIGAPHAGSVYVYERDGPVWASTEVLSGPADFGDTVAISGDTLAVGVPGMSSVVMFERGGDGWSEAARLIVPDTGCLGSVIAGTAGVLVAGDPCGTSAAYVFERGADGWMLAGELPSSGDSLFGRAVAIDGDLILVGGRSLWSYERVSTGWSGPTRVSASSGAAVVLAGRTAATGLGGELLVFEMASTAEGSIWQPVTTIQPQDTSTLTLFHERFGWSLDATEDVIVAGAWMDDGSPGLHDSGQEMTGLCVVLACVPQTPGAVYVFERGGGGEWAQTAKLSGEVTSGHRFGESVAIDGDATTIFVGAPGHPLITGGRVDLTDNVHVFTRLGAGVGS